ncbi:MAG: 2-oxoacid:acceptor oxidoreductase subunit alpha [Candidatus Levyibacteriota bacterium]
MEEIFRLTFGGMAGQGIKAAGLILAKIATRSGKQVFTYSGYPSLIRGGHNFTQVSISKGEVTSPGLKNDFWVALDQNTLRMHKDEFSDGCGILYDEGKNYDLSGINPQAKLYPIPLSQFAKEAGGPELLSNTVALGAVVALLGGNVEILKDMLREEFGHKGDEAVEMNYKAVSLGYEHMKDKMFREVLKPEEQVTPRMVANSNDMAALGAIAAGLQFAAIYPMSPASNIMHVLAAHQKEYGYVYKQPEDEISAINMAIGASMAGVRSMTATSGGGFSLMTEAFGLAGMTEMPIVIVNAMRPGPATGLPTWSGQGDLQFVRHAHQGDFLRIILAAGDAEETFHLTTQAFNLAEKYQTPVIILTDKNLCEHDQSMPLPDMSSYSVDRGKFTTDKQEDYKRYKVEEDGISLRSPAGTPNFFLANSYEHDEYGFDTEEPGMINAQMEKRMRKQKTCREQEDISPKLFGNPEADLTIVSWGSNKGSILQSLKEFPNVNFLHITWINPFPAQKVKEVLSSAKNVLNVEGNISGQMASLIREQTGIEITNHLLKYDGRPIFPEEIADKIKSIIG